MAHSACMPLPSLHPRSAHDTALDAAVVDGEVVVIGHRASESLTPEAALESAVNIRAAAEQAIRERPKPDTPT